MKDQRLLAETVGPERLNRIQLANEYAYLNLEAIGRSFFRLQFKPTDGDQISAVRKSIQEHASTFKSFSEKKIGEISSFGEKAYIGGAIAFGITHEIGKFQDKLRDEGYDTFSILETYNTKRNEDFPDFIDDINLSALDYKSHPEESYDLTIQMLQPALKNLSNRMAICNEVNHTEYGEFLQNHQFDLVYDTNGLPHTLDYLDTIGADTPFTMAVDGNLTQFQKVQNGDKATIERTTLPERPAKYMDSDLCRNIINTMADTLKDVDPTLLPSSKEFKDLRKSIATLQQDAKNLGKEDAPEFQKHLRETFEKANSYLEYREFGDGRNKNKSEIALKRIAAARACSNGLKSMLDAGIGKEKLQDIAPVTNHLSSTEVLLEASVARNHDQNSITALESMGRIKAALVIPENERKGLSALQAHQLIEDITTVSLAKLITEKKEDPSQGISKKSMQSLLNDEKTRTFFHKSLIQNYGEQLKKGDFSGLLSTVSDRKGMDQLFMDVYNLSHPMKSRTVTTESPTLQTNKNPVSPQQLGF